mgnify:FL=1
MTVKEKRYGISISLAAGVALKQLQATLERQIGFKPSMSQVVEFLVSDYQSKNQTNSTQNHR